MPVNRPDEVLNAAHAGLFRMLKPTGVGLPPSTTAGVNEYTCPTAACVAGWPLSSRLAELVDGEVEEGELEGVELEGVELEGVELEGAEPSSLQPVMTVRETTDSRSPTSCALIFATVFPRRESDVEIPSLSSSIKESVCNDVACSPRLQTPTRVDSFIGRGAVYCDVNNGVTSR